MARNFRDLIIWQLARELRLHVLHITAQRPIDSDFRHDLRRAARSVPSNIAEGHGRFRPTENHHFLEIAMASLKEIENHLGDGIESAYFTEQEYEAAMRLIRRISPAMSSQMRYLRSPAAEANYRRMVNQSRSTSRPRTKTNP
jgi:four helix bundle protein